MGNSSSSHKSRKSRSLPTSPEVKRYIEILCENEKLFSHFDIKKKKDSVKLLTVREGPNAVDVNYKLL